MDKDQASLPNKDKNKDKDFDRLHFSYNSTVGFLVVGT